MSVKIQVRRGSGSEWNAADPTLDVGEIGYNTTNGAFKIGDGSTIWSSLQYVVNDSSLSTSLGDYIALSEKNSAGGVATLDENSKLTLSQLPDIAQVTVHAVADQTARLALTVEVGDIAIQADNGQTYVLSATPASTNGNWNAITVADPFPSHDTDDLTEGSTNKYYLDSRARGAVSGGTGLDYDSETGIFDIDSTVTTNTGTQTLENKTISYEDNTVTVQVANVSDLTATATELNTLDGITSSTSELNILDGVTADYTEINILDGATLSTAELNTLDGITASTTELNILDGATLSTTELNYVDGVTSSIQDQLDDKADLAGASFTGVISTSDATDTTSGSDGSIHTAGGLGIVKDLYVGGNATIDGDLTVNGTYSTVPAESLVVENPMIYMADANPANTMDIGIVGSHTISGTYSHVGFVLDASDAKWKLFSGVTSEPTSTVDFTSATYGTLKAGSFEGDLTGDVTGDVSGNAGTVTDGVYTTDTATVTNTMLAGSIANNKLSNSKVTIGSTDISLGDTATTIAGLSSVTSTSFVGALTGNADTVTNGIYTSGSYSNPSWLTGLTWSKISSTPTTASGYGITDAVVTGGSYSDPSWLTISKSKVGLGDVENTAISTWAGTTNITTLGTVTSGTWSAGTIALNKGGTGATTQAGAANAILPTQTSNTGKYLKTDGTDVSWATVDSYLAPTLGSTSIGSGATVTTISALTLNNAVLSGTLQAGATTGTNGQVLTVVSGSPAWQDSSGGVDVAMIIMGAY